MNKIVWTHHSTKEWIGETDEGHSYRIIARGRSVIAQFFRMNGRGFMDGPIDLGDPIGGTGVMDTLRSRCSKHYQDLLAGKEWECHCEMDPYRLWMETPHE